MIIAQQRDRPAWPLHASPSQDTFADSVQRTQQPIVTGTSVLATKFKDGVMMAADNLASYGSLARFKDVQRDYTIIGAGGDMSDFQYVQHLLDDVAVQEIAAQDGRELDVGAPTYQGEGANVGLSTGIGCKRNTGCIM